MKQSVYKILLIVILNSLLLACSPALISLPDLPAQMQCVEPIRSQTTTLHLAPISSEVHLRIEGGKLVDADNGAVLLIKEYDRVNHFTATTD